MTVQTAELEGHVSEYLQRVRSTGEAITVCEGSQPVAVLAPASHIEKQKEANLIDRLLDSPWPVKDFKPLSRSDIYERGKKYTEYW